MMTRKHAIVSLLAFSLFSLVVGSGCSQDIDDIRAEGIQQYRNRQYVESMATLRHGLSMKAADPQCNYYMGLNYRAIAAAKFRDGDIPGAQRELDTAIIYFSQAIKSWPNWLAAIEAKTEAFEARGKYAQALDTVDAVAYNNRGAAAEHYIHAGDTYRDMGDYDNALKRYQMALASDPNNARAYASIGKLYSIVGDRSKALDAFAKAYQLNPGDNEVNDQLARLGVNSSASETFTEQQPRQ
ncbi:MAG TPA: tetratricopeptide repeat protein [Phycisphaerae bacterium]|jgi:tetratricopeptide (TPR) repeat protein|nr:tetratricopeptide repeat protein [Phycisphaerae bacterium]HOB73259.1 tetratricopeptide repeat protein [Phycisphaerae bacterium]HOJ54893.1 tetratricopeptide repeat protein [Phycisphaerae bacterium]HOL26079.1 tetratricopeptide repeat protein [Phycisphaerae bacterium]HPP21533.1 tetratricopeptide repeat protein [Phycisphaerae bacterium]